MIHQSNNMRGSRKFCQRVSNSENVFVVDEGREDPNTIKWRFASGSMIAQLGCFVTFMGSGTVFLRNPITL